MLCGILCALALTTAPMVDRIEEALCARDRLNDAEWSAVPDKAALLEKRAQFKERFRRALGYHAIQRTPLNARSLGVRDYGAFRIEKVLMESAPGEFVAVLVFIPAAGRFAPPYAGFVFIPGHSDNGKAHETYIRTCELGARSGLLSAIYDPLGQGERSQGAGLRCADEHVRIGAYAALLGETTATYMLRDAVRVVDYLASRPDVDSAKIGACGNSGGGTLSAYLMVADDRIRAATPSCYLSSAREHLVPCGPQDSEQNFFDGFSWGFNHAALVLSAGCPVLMNAAAEDVFPVAGSRSTYEIVKTAAARAGMPEGWYELSVAPGPHMMSKIHRERAVAFLLRHLRGEVREVSETENFDFGGDDCTVTPDGEVSRLAGFTSVYEELERKFAAQGVSAEQEARNARGLVIRECGGTDCRDVLATLRGRIVEGERAVLRVGGAAEPGEATATLFAEGPRYVPRTHRSGKLSYYDRRGTDEVVAVDLYMSGRSLVALRAAELLTLAAELRRRTGFAPALVAVGRFATVAKFAVAAQADAFSQTKYLDEPKPFLDALKSRDYLSFADSGALYSGK